MKKSTEYIHQQKVNDTIDYISAHLSDRLTLRLLSERAHVSQRQLLRIMQSALDESLHSYIARQRSERAVLYMQMDDRPIAEIAEMVGYESSQSFGKAFKKHFGISPRGYMTQLRERLQSHTNECLSSHESPPPSVVSEEDDLNLVYIRILGKYGEEEPYRIAWDKLLSFLSEKKSISAHTRFIGISFDDPNVTKPTNCRFYACATVEGDIAPKGEFGTIRIQGGKYAVYTLIGSQTGLQPLYNRIMLNPGYIIRHGLAFEEYINHTRGGAEVQTTKIYIPIK